MHADVEQPRYRPLGRLVLRRIGQDQLLVPVSGEAARSNAVFPLNRTGAFVWERVSAGKTIEDTAREMTAAFVVEFEVARADCEQYAGELVAQRLLEVVA